MNEIAFADKLDELIGSVMNDGPDMLNHVACSFANDTLIDKVEYIGGGRDRMHRLYSLLEITTVRGEVFRLTVTQIKEPN